MNGVYPAALTMFDRFGRLDLDATADHLDWLVREGAHGLVVGGTSGEFVALTGEERRALLETAVETVAGRVPVLAGTGAYTTAETVALTAHAEAAGAAAALVVLPYFQRPSREEVLAHYRAVAAAGGVPIWVYNIPANAAVPALDVPDLTALHADGVVQGVKSTLPTVHQLSELSALPGFHAFYGGFTSPLEALAGGAHGWISGLLNIVPAAAAGVWEAVRAGDLALARARWAELLPVRRMLFQPPVRGVGDLALYRGVLRIRGRTAGHCRAPLRDLSAEELRVLEKAISG
ncbi:dihydrodipicolinate synthase family protein [Nonomuraea endophytica]|uniref:4-hydroxy-tetrahydrodipicolinate synthase n=1 Tax=Nonomuraea endophytica TaxID=714136 RepID=A0A7W8ABM8_9ACTN|nr:dihydrodipicolinate synthase family protein [Nonomuraea endophytica]MBB5082146.1 4-hydroxy-tetrahydrodipicolinate synthase [Nonomuraea endophytica]